MISAPGPKLSDLKLRAVSGCVLICIAAVELYVGGTVLAISMAFLAAAMAWETLSVIGVRRSKRALPAVIVLASLLTLVPIFQYITGGSAYFALALSVVAVLSAWSVARHTKLVVPGIVMFAAVCLGMIVLVLAEQRAGAFQAPPLMVLVPAVVGTDIGAYFIGRMIGGPKLAPSISPKKTWSGAVGGVLSAIGLGLLTYWIAVSFAMIEDRASIWFLCVSLALLSVCAQIGDLLESWLKRRAGKKDSSRIIPGHGGLLDRFDGFLGAAVLGLGPWFAFVSGH